MFFIRSLLSVPGNRPSMLEKARALPADGLHLDLEDAVPPAEKERTRQEGEELFFARWTVALAARAAGVLALDTTYPNYQDDDGLIQDALRARRMGFHGKFLIHPRQIDPVNRLFLPSPEEVEEAQRVVAAFEEALARGHATTSLDGSIIDTAIAERPRRVLAIAQAPGRRGPSPYSFRRGN